VSGISHDKLYIYDPIGELFFTSQLKVEKNSTKILLVQANLLILLESSGGFCTSYNGDDWASARFEGFHNEIPTSYRVTQEKSVFFECSRWIFKLNLKQSQKLEQVYLI